MNSVKLLITTSLLSCSGFTFANCDYLDGSGEIIRGSVYEDRNDNDRHDRVEPGIAGASVSNGCDVVVTDAGGSYQIEIHPTQILFVSKPANYRVKVDEYNVPRFFYRHYPTGTPQQIAGTAVDWAWPVISSSGPLPSFINFGFLPDPQASANFSAHGFADTQARFDLGEDMLREDLVSPLIGNPYGVEFGLTVGDVVYDNLALYERHKKMMGLMDIPQWYLPGNHDINFNSPNGIFANETFKSHFGPTYYSFNQGNVHFVALNNVEYAGLDQRFGNSSYRGFIPQYQLDWLEQDLANVSPDKLIVIATHIPLVSEADDGFSTPISGPLTENFASLLEILAPFSNIYGLAGHDTSSSWKVAVGHDHGWQGQPWIAHTLAEVRGSGWTKGKIDERGVKDAVMDDGNPNGFYLLKFADTTLTPQFKPFPFGADGNKALRITLDPALSQQPGGSINRGQLNPATKVVVNLFDGGVRDQVFVSLDDQDFMAMTYTVRTDPHLERLHQQNPEGDESYNAPTRSAHIWEIALPENLESGLHVIHIKTEDEFGQTHSSALSFEILP
ncbi:MAG: hypothetical protein ACI95C_000831 [Pseudohongiellaceae bacterium]|jgi:hypothetical protein